jgi:hypothetical protein
MTSSRTLGDAEPQVWRITEHCCRVDLGRVLVRTDAKGQRHARCADCGFEAIGNHDAVCICGVDTGAAKVRLRCERQAQTTSDSPSEIVVVEVPR